MGKKARSAGIKLSITVLLGIAGKTRSKIHALETGLLHQTDQFHLIVESLGVELIGDDAFVDVGDDFPGDEPLLVAGEGAFAADEQLFVDPFPGARLKGLFEIIAVGNIDQ